MRAGKTLVMVLVIALSIGMLALALVSVSRANRTAALHDQAVRQLRAGDYANAREVFEDVLDLRSDEPAYLANYGLCLEMLGDTSGAVDAYRKSLELSDDAQVRFQMGRASCDSGQVETGVQIMWQVNSAVILTARQMGDLGLCLERSGRPTEALPYLEQGLSTSPDNPDWRAALDRASVYRVVQ